MKAPLWVSLGVVVVGGWSGMRQQAHVDALRREFDTLSEAARRSGIALNKNASASRRGRATEDRAAASLVNEVMDLLGRAHAMERTGGKPDDGWKDQIVALTVRLSEVSPAHMRKVLVGMLADDTISQATKAKVIEMSILLVSEDHPEDALLLVQESKEVLGKGAMASHVVTSALQSWAKTNPMAAVGWLQSQQESPMGIRREEMTRAVVAGAAEGDPAAAFDILSALDLETNPEAYEAIASSTPGSPQGRDALLAAMRDHLAAWSDPAKAEEITRTVLENMARGVEKNSFEEVSTWLEKSQLSGQELGAFASGLNWFTTGKETGEWLDWMEKRVPADQLAEPVGGLMGDWVEEDYLAAGQWLTRVADGPIKTPAVKAYAEAVAAYDPEVATQWAMTIKDADARIQTLRSIRDHWPAHDEAGAQRFAAEHGLEE